MHYTREKLRGGKFSILTNFLGNSWSRYLVKAHQHEVLDNTCHQYLGNREGASAHVVRVRLVPIRTLSPVWSPPDYHGHVIECICWNSVFGSLSGHLGR